MSAISEADVRAVLGETDALVLRELIRTQACTEELARALEFVCNGSSADANASRSLPSRLQRLVDLLSVTGLREAGGGSTHDFNR
jgi:hypothetical protein